MQQATQHSLVASLLGTLPAGSDGSPNSSGDGLEHKPSSLGRGAAARGRVDVDKAAAPNGANGTGSSAQDEHEPAQPVALSPVDVREMLSHCDDATMSWSLQFWVTIADPLTHHVFFACPASGQCSWEPPVGAFVVPRSPDGEWWELADPSRNNQSYYYIVAVDAPDDDSTPGSHDHNMERDASREFLAEGSTPLQQPPPPSQHLSPVASGSSPARSQEERAGWWDRRKSRKARPRIMDIGPVVGHTENSILPSPPRSPIPIDDGSVNLTFQPASPTQAAYDTHTSFSTDMFADRYFATKRSGVLRTRLPLERIMEWQRNPISSPLLVLSKSSVQDAITTFKVIQHVMGERDRPVDAARAPHGSPSLSLRSKGAEADTSETKMVILEEIRWMLQLGVGRTEMRDEIYCQLIKQLTRNPDQDATVLGFQLFCVFVHAFGPSKSFEPFVQSFLVRNVERTDYGIGIMSKFCLARLDSWLKNGGRGRVLTVAEIEHASDAAFYPSVYGQTLETIMQRQEGAYPELRIPIILPFLADGILALGGTEAEGIFRVPGDQDAIADLKARIDRGHYQLGGIDDPHVTGSLFKMWLRELDEPLVPTKQYNAALEASKDVDNTIIFLKKLPDHNRRVLLFVISFMQLFLDPAVVAITKMTPSNLALVLAPNILRTTSEELSTVYNNTSFECRFVLNLLLHLDPPSVDPEYVPTHGAGERSSLDESDQEEDEFHESHDDDVLEAERAE
ncbi:Rho GTPase-activating protein 39 [Vanrija pseudolonga]|uniref:Rho GTPase-activating protein 39 n=1 Tax=Vanrija pseudolonga TaxID=143232 RepID=A0AAF0Y6Y9_9TREE|nr:Rho GTPase-activating protein 39 [Vanrija pseudolonga]